MSQTFSMQMTRTLALAPALQRSLRLLQMNALEFNQEVQNALDSNPMLEDAEPASDAEPMSQGETDERDIAEAVEPGSDHLGDTPTLETVFESGPDPSTLGMTDWGSVAPQTARQHGERDLSAIDVAAADRSLRDHLLAQLGALGLPDLERALASIVVDSIDPTGYLREDLDSLVEIGRQVLNHATLEGCFEVCPVIDASDMQLALTRVQSLEPAGVGARSVSECLLIQLRNLAPGTQGLMTATRIVLHHLDLLAENDFRLLSRAVDADDDALSAATRLIRSLDPKPGLAFGGELVAYAVPEVIVRKERGVWVASLHPTATPRVRINPNYAAIVARQATSNDGLGQQLQEAQWLLRSIDQRAETIIRTAMAIVARQQSFFEHGDIGLKPMKLADIAADVGVHESTVSRVVNSKYLQCPSGLVPLRRFFTSHVETSAGIACSATAVKAMIRQLVSAEPAGEPHSDHRLTRLLTQRGIRISRRTVTKYRDALGIDAADLRRQLTPTAALTPADAISVGTSGPRSRGNAIRRVTRSATRASA